MNKKPILFRTIFTLIVVVVFVWSMFPLKESDFYDTFLTVVENPEDPKIVELIDLAKAKQEKDKVNYSYPSVALEAAAKEIKIKSEDGRVSSMDLIKYVNPVITKSQKLQSNGDVISLVRKKAAGSIHLGIDLNGGAEFLLQLVPDEKAKGNFDRFRDNAIETLRKRLESRSIFESEISPAGQDLVSVRVPVVTKDEKAMLEKLILRSAKLEFRLVHPDNQTELTKFYNFLAQGNDPYEYLDTPPESEFMSIESRDSNGELQVQYFLIENEVQMEGDQIQDSSVVLDQFNMRQISLSFTKAGADKFREVTTKNVGRDLAIILDGKLYSAPRLQVPITDGHASITGSFSQDEAKELSDCLVSGSLPFTITIASRSDIDPTVGSETVHQSMISGIVGILLVMIFMVIYYRTAGFVANLSLIFNAIIMIGALAAFNVTLTLPGIAGLILTIGMAVDANVLIYERIREEINAGKSVVNAVDIGFGRAFSAIFDSNLTTLFVAIILYLLGSGAIKGFAMTLAIGIFTTMFTAVFMTKLFFDLILRFINVKSLNMMYLLKEPKINFIKLSRYAIIVSVVLIVASLGLMIGKGRNILGIDFTGGTQLLINYTQKDSSKEVISPSEIKKFLSEQGYDANVTYKKTNATEENEEGSNLLEIVIRDRGNTSISSEISDNLIKTMDKAYPDVVFTKQSESTLGALIGKSFMISAIIALSLSLVGMILYMMVRFQFSYSIAANIALIHDVIISMGIYFALGGQFTLQVLASVLTLIGYSVNDTIVTFDRQRENLKLLQGKTYTEIVNISINQTLGRTILTSLSVVLILVAQLLFGGDGIKDFIAVMLIGCFVGCYSSVFISPTITAYWHKVVPNVKEEGSSEMKEAEEAPAEN